MKDINERLGRVEEKVNSSHKRHDKTDTEIQLIRDKYHHVSGITQATIAKVDVTNERLDSFNRLMENAIKSNEKLDKSLDRLGDKMLANDKILSEISETLAEMQGQKTGILSTLTTLAKIIAWASGIAYITHHLTDWFKG